MSKDSRDALKRMCNNCIAKDNIELKCDKPCRPYRLLKSEIDKAELLDIYIERWHNFKEGIKKEKETRIYDRYCNGCMQEKKCHEECTRCDMVAAIYEWEGM